MITSLELFVTLKTSVPPALKLKSLPAASNIISAGESNVISPEDVPIVTAASPVDISSAALDTLPNDKTPEPFVYKN